MLTSAHQGYYYQDLLGAYFLAKEIANGRLDTKFRFDKKEKKGDSFDDLVIWSKGKTYRRQIKYSNAERNHQLCKGDLANGGGYGLALSELFRSWKALDDNNSEYRLCLAWNRPSEDDAILKILALDTTTNLSTSEGLVYKVNPNKLWPKGNKPLSSWQKFGKEMKKEDRKDFLLFCEQLVIEVELPKANLSLSSPNAMERALLHEIHSIGVGEFPNENVTQRTVASYLIEFVRRHRMDDKKERWETTTMDAVNDAKLNLHFGSIEQKFPIVREHLIETNSSIDEIFEALDVSNKLIVEGEPGAGKSWLIENLESALPANTHLVKHYCYTKLDDSSQTKRIQSNTLYGNIINQLVGIFEDLEEHKINRYAANLSELNQLISKIQEDTIIIVDGLDHVWRIYETNRKELREGEIGVLEALQQIEINNPKVKLLVFSQPISQLSALTGFKRIKILPWTSIEIATLMENHFVEDKLLEDDKFISSFIQEKSAGNALYASYIIKSIYKESSVSKSTIDNLPNYTFNLESYYEYLLKLIEFDQRIPLAFCAINFSINESDIYEITGLGKRVEKYLGVLLPILNHNSAYGGYKIYHESFKRFMIERLREEEMDIPTIVYEPVAKWLSKKDFYSFRKAGLYLLPLFCESRKLDKIADTIETDFIQKCLFFGHPLEIIKTNHSLQAKSLVATQDLNKIIIIAEQSKIIVELGNFDTNACEQYLITIKHIHGEQAMYDCIYNEGRLLLDRKKVYGLLKDSAYRGEVVNWGIIPVEKMMFLDEFDAIVVQQLYNKNYDKIEEYASRFIENSEDDKKWDNILVNEVRNWNEHNGDSYWLNDYPIIKNFLSPKQPKVTINILNKKIEELIKMELTSGEKRVELVQSIKKQVHELVLKGKQELVLTSIDSLRKINWFHNWVQFTIWITIYKARKIFSFEELESAFFLLISDLDKYKGTPRLVDLYSLKWFIRTSFEQGLSLCKSLEESKKCLDILQRLSDKTTVHIQKSYTGPLIPEEFLDLQVKFQLPEVVIPVYEKELNYAQQNRVYGDLAWMNFRISTVYHQAGIEEMALYTFKEGIKQLTGYGLRKDRTLSELIEGCVPYIQMIPEGGEQIMEHLYRMSMTVVNHTDRKGTSHYPIEWYHQYYAIFPKRALAFLATEILDSSWPHYYEEEQLEIVLQQSSGGIDPLIEFLLLSTFPNSGGKKYYKNKLETFSKLKEHFKPYFLNRMITISRNAGIDRYDKEFSRQLVIEFQKLVGKENARNFKIKQDKKEGVSRPEKIVEFKALSINEALEILDSKNFDVFSKKSIQTFLSSLSSFQDRKLFIKAILRKGRYQQSTLGWLDEFFNRESEDWFFIQVATFVYREDGWFHIMDNPDSFVKVYKSNPEKSKKYLLEILSELLSDSNYTQQVSANLIKGLIACDVHKDLIKQLWENVFNIIDKRISYQYDYDFSKEIDLSLYNFSKEELLACLLFSRLKGMTIERVHRTVHGIFLLAHENPKILIKPLEWVINKQDKLLPLHLAILLQIILETPLSDNLTDEVKKTIDKIYPTNFYWTDFLIEELLNKPSRVKIIEEDFVIHPSSSSDVQILEARQYRYRRLSDEGIDLYLIAKEADVKMAKEQSLLENYYNRMNDVNVLNIKHGAILFELFQSRFYNQFRRVQKIKPQKLFSCMPLDINKIVAQVGSRKARPSDLVYPSKGEYNWEMDQNFYIKDKWVRIASVETEYYGDSFKKLSPIIYHQSLIFDDNVDDNTSKFSKYRLLFELYDGKSRNLDIESTPIIHCTEYDFFERINLLWLSPAISQALGIQIKSPLYFGLKGVNTAGEEVLQFQSWSEDYIGGDVGHNEFAKLSGGELLMRIDYFEMMKDFFPKINPKIIKKAL